MKKIVTLTLTALCALSATVFAGGLSTGTAAPDFTLTDSNGKSRSLSEFKGKNIVLEWTNYQCPFVVKHYTSDNMQDLQKTYTEKDVVWLSICSSAPGKQGNKKPKDWNAQIKKADAKPTALLIDEDGKIGHRYAAKTTPHMYVINAEGILVYQGAIDSVRSTKAKDIDGAENYVASALDELLAGKDITTSTTKPYGCGVKYQR